MFIISSRFSFKISFLFFWKGKINCGNQSCKFLNEFKNSYLLHRAILVVRSSPLRIFHKISVPEILKIFIYLHATISDHCTKVSVCKMTEQETQAKFTSDEHLFYKILLENVERTFSPTKFKLLLTYTGRLKGAYRSWSYLRASKRYLNVILIHLNSAYVIWLHIWKIGFRKGLREDV